MYSYLVYLKKKTEQLCTLETIIRSFNIMDFRIIIVIIAPRYGKRMIIDQWKQ